MHFLMVFGKAFTELGLGLGKIMSCPNTDSVLALLTFNPALFLKLARVFLFTKPIH